MLGINSNINSLVAQQNLATSGSALSQAITRLSSGKRINSAADDAAGLAISNIMQSQVNGLNQGVSNANDGVSMVQTASSGLSSLTSSLQTIRQLAVEASDGSMTDTDRAALQQEVSQQVSEINRIASQTTFNGMNVLNGSLGNVSFQVGANVGQSITMNLSQNMSAADLGGGKAQAGNTLGSFTVNLTSGGAYNGTQGVPGSSTQTGTETATLGAVTASNDGTTTTYTMGGSALTDAHQIALANAAYAAQNSGTTLDQAAQAAYTANSNTATDVTGTATTVIATSTDGSTAAYSLNGTATTDAATISAADAVYDDTSGSSNSMATDAEAAQATATPVVSAGTAPTPSTTTTAAITQINVVADGNGSFTLTDQNNQPLTQAAAQAIFQPSGSTLGLTVGQDSSGNTTLSFSATGATDAAGNAITDAGTAIADALDAVAGVAAGSSDASATDTVGKQITALNAPSTVAAIDISTQTGASQAMEAIDSALNTVNNLQATLGAAQNRFTAISTTQQAQSTDLASAQSSIQDADFAQETANLSKAQVLQQAGISVLAQANSQPQQILKLLQG